MDDLLKYVNTEIVFKEIPNEITLAINISRCPYKCKGCHSSYLQENTGETINEVTLDKLIKKNEGITCVALMGGDLNPSFINYLGNLIKRKYNLKSAWYSGNNKIDERVSLSNFDYIKIGEYKEELGGLTSKNTNQIMYEISDNKLININYKFNT